MIINKMWCVGFFAAVMTLGVTHGKEADTVMIQSSSPEIKCCTTVKDAVARIRAEKKLLIDDVIAIVSPHLSQDEIDRLNAHLQDLARKVTVQNLFEIHKELKADVTRLGVLALLGIKTKSTTTGSGTTSLETTSLEQHLQRILENISLVQYEKFVRANAIELSKMIARILANKLPDCVPALAEAAATISSLKQPDKIQTALASFLSKATLGSWN